MSFIEFLDMVSAFSPKVNLFVTWRARLLICVVFVFRMACSRNLITPSKYLVKDYESICRATLHGVL